MTGAALQVDLSQLDKVNDYLERLDGFARFELLDTVGAVVESQTRRRIEEQQGAPDGTPWPVWSDKYAATRHANHAILLGEGDMLDSLTYLPHADSVEVGSNIIYFATHQFGDDDRGIPARPSLGLSDDDEAELEQVVNQFFEGLL